MTKKMYVSFLSICFGLLTIVSLASVGQPAAAAENAMTHTVYLPIVRKPLDVAGRVVMVGYWNFNYDIYSMNADGSDVRRLTTTSDRVINLNPTWSPDGSKVAFARFNNGTGREVGIYVMNADGSNLVRLTNSDGLGNDFAPVWSPDGSKIAYFTTNNSAEQIVVMNSDGSNPQILTHWTYRSVAPHWSPDGSKLVYASTQGIEQNGRFEIFTMNPDGSNRQRLTHNPNADDNAPRWSPDGSKISFYSYRNSQSATYVMNADGSNVQQIPNIPLAVPAWSPTGNKLMFAARPDATNNTEIYVVNIDGSDLTRITTTTNLLEDSPDWR